MPVPPKAIGTGARIFWTGVGAALGAVAGRAANGDNTGAAWGAAIGKHAAIAGKHLEVARFLLQRGADPNAHVESSGNCMSMAKHNGASREMTQLLASYGAVMTTELLCYYGENYVRDKPERIFLYFVLLIALCLAAAYLSEFSGAFWLLLLPPA